MPSSSTSSRCERTSVDSGCRSHRASGCAARVHRARIKNADRDSRAPWPQHAQVEREHPSRPFRALSQVRGPIESPPCPCRLSVTKVLPRSRPSSSEEKPSWRRGPPRPSDDRARPSEGRQAWQPAPPQSSRAPLFTKPAGGQQVDRAPRFQRRDDVVDEAPDEEPDEEQDEEAPEEQPRWAAGQPRWADERGPNIRDRLVADVLYGVFPVLNALKTKR